MGVSLSLSLPPVTRSLGSEGGSRPRAGGEGPLGFEN